MEETLKAIITTIDNLPMLKQQIPILQSEPLSEIIVVNNGSEDGTAEWLSSVAGTVIEQSRCSSWVASEDWRKNDSGIIAINRPNYGAGAARNTGLNVAGNFDYVLMLDGGIRPLRGGVAGMLAYMKEHSEVDVLSPEIATCYTTNADSAHRRFVSVERTFRQNALSGTAYALCNHRAWDGLRFSEEGPFGQPGWGVDDNEMACRWWEAGIVHLDFTGVKLYRRESGSFARLFRETGVWPNQYGSVYEQRVVLLVQTYPQYFDPIWHKTHLQISCVVHGEYPRAVYIVKAIHEELKDVPHEIIFAEDGVTAEMGWWLDTFSLRWPHGDATIDAESGQILRRNSELEPIWTGNVVRAGSVEKGIAKARGDEIWCLGTGNEDAPFKTFGGSRFWHCQRE